MLYCSKSHTAPIIQLQANQIETTGDIAVKLGQFFFRIISVNKNNIKQYTLSSPFSLIG